MWVETGISIWLVGLSFYDIREKKVPVIWLLSAGILSFVYLFIGTRDGNWNWILFVRSVIPGFLMLIIALATGKAGWADGVVLILLGVLEGYYCSLIVFAVSLFSIAFFSAALLVLRRAGRNSRIPYIPFITLGWIVSLFGDF